jgi:hypothetical protein
VPLTRGKKFVRITDGIDGRGCLKKQKPACNGQDRGMYLNLKGCRIETGVSRQRKEVFQ